MCSNTPLAKLRTTSSTPTCFVLHDTAHKSGLSCPLVEILGQWLFTFKEFWILKIQRKLWLLPATPQKNSHKHRRDFNFMWGKHYREPLIIQNPHFSATISHGITIDSYGAAQHTNKDCLLPVPTQISPFYRWEKWHMETSGNLSFSTSRKWQSRRKWPSSLLPKTLLIRITIVRYCPHSPVLIIHSFYLT